MLELGGGEEVLRPLGIPAQGDRVDIAVEPGGDLVRLQAENADRRERRRVDGKALARIGGAQPVLVGRRPGDADARREPRPVVAEEVAVEAK